MSVWARLKVWIAGDVLTAGDLNGEFNNLGLVNTFDWTWSGTQTFNNSVLKLKGAGAGIATLNNANTATNRILTLPDPGADSTLMALAGAQTVTGAKTFSGANTLLIPTTAPSAGTGSTAVVNNQLTIWDGTSGRVYVPIDKSSTVIHNIGSNLNAGAISITGLETTALSASNAAWISYPATANLWSTHTVTANQTISSGGLKGRWGTTASVAWGSDMPLAIGVCSKDASPSGIRFFLTRNPAMTSTPASTNNIGIDGTAPATSDQNNIVLFGSAANTSYNSRPCRIIGAVRATCDNSAGGVWAITAFDNGDGIGNFFNFGPRKFTMPQGQNGAVASRYMLASGGTTPQWSTMFYEYSLGMDGMCTIGFRFDGDGGTDGVGAGTALISTPYIHQTTSNSYAGTGYAKWAATNEQNITVNPDNLVSNTAICRNTSATARVSFVNSDFSAGARTLEGSVTYPAFI